MTGDMVKSKEILDLDSGEFHAITPERQKVAAYLHQQVYTGAFVIAFALRRIFDGKYYLDLGCSSIEEYCMNMLPFNKSQAYRYYKIAEKFSAALPGVDGPEALVNSRPELAEIGVTKLAEMVKLDDEDFKTVVDGGTLHYEEHEVSLETVREKSVREMRESIKSMRDKYSERVSILEEKNLQLKEEAEANAEFVERAKNRYELGSELERKYGEKAVQIEAKQDRMDIARRQLNDLQIAFAAIGVNTDDPDALQRDMFDLINKLHEVYEVAQGLYGHVILSVEQIS